MLRRVKSYYAILFLLGLTASAFSHETLVYPVHVTVAVDPGELTAVVKMHAAYVHNEILDMEAGYSLPGNNWPDPIVQRAKTYIERCLTFNVDGQSLQVQHFEPRFIQEPLRPDESQLEFTLTYRLPASPQRLSGEAAFFKEAKLDAHPPEEASPSGEKYITYLEVQGKNPVHFELPIENPDFDIPLEGMTRSPLARMAHRLAHVGYIIISSPFFWIAFIFTAVSLVRRLKRKRSA